MSLAEDTGSDLPLELQALLYRAELLADDAHADDWDFVAVNARRALELDSANVDALAILQMAAEHVTDESRGSHLSDDAHNALLNENATGSEQVWVIHYFSHFGASWSERAAFKHELRHAGFGTGGERAEVNSDEEITGDTYWHHWAITAVALSPDVTAKLDELARVIAARHAVRYDRWEPLKHSDGRAVPRP